MSNYLPIFIFLLTLSSGDNSFCASPGGCDEPDNFVFINSSPIVNLGVVACGERGEETMVMVKSALLFSTSRLTLHLFSEDELKPYFIEKCEYFKSVYGSKFDYRIYPIIFPRVDDVDVWKGLFKLCASQRLFIPDLLKKIDSLIYVDTDILFLRPIDDLWKMFEDFTENQIAGLSAEHEEPRASWYHRFARHPYVPPYGVNSGVMLMNLTRMRSIDWLLELLAFQKQYRYNITWGDQDLLNIFFSRHPEQLYQFQCSWNYRMDHCMYGSNCVSARDEGVSVLHGNRNAFHNNKFPSLRAFYDAINEYDLESWSLVELKESIIFKTNPHLSTNCGEVTEFLTKNIFKYLI